MDTYNGRVREPATLHKFMYAHADPTNNIDPSGHMTLGSISAGIRSMGTLSNISRVGSIQARVAINRTLGATLRVAPRKLIKRELRKLRRCIRRNNKCSLGVNLLIVGLDNPSMIAHIRDAQSRYPRSHYLTYEPYKQGRRNWYKNNGNCRRAIKPGALYQCDEYPFYKTREGGQENAYRVSLRWVPMVENMSIGGHFGYLARSMKKANTTRKFVVVVSRKLPSIAIPK